MRAFILAAGEGTRMWPLTENRPKPLIPLANKPIIEHIMDSVIDAGVERISILIGYEGRKIAERYGYGYRGAEIDYVYQEHRLGTGHAALHAERYEDEKILFVNGDLYFSPESIKEILKYDNAVLGVFREDAAQYGILIGEEYLERIDEKVPGAKNKWVNGGIYVLKREIFEYLHKMVFSPRGEMEFTDAVNMMAKEERIKIVKFKGWWIDIGRPWDLLAATEMYLQGVGRRIEGEIEKNVIIKGDVVIGRGTRVLSGTYIEGPVIIGENCKIGPNAYIRPDTVIGNHCHVGNSTEVKASIMMDNSNAPHFNYVGDSIIGERCNLGAGTKIANLRLDEKSIGVYVKGKRVNTGRRKLGVIMGDDVHTGINASIDVGTLIGSGSFIAPGVVVRGVVKRGSRIY